MRWVSYHSKQLSRQIQRQQGHNYYQPKDLSNKKSSDYPLVCSQNFFIWRIQQEVSLLINAIQKHYRLRLLWLSMISNESTMFFAMGKYFSK
jgi:hypothetical protein